MGFFNALAKRIQKGQSGLTGHEITFETEQAAKEWQAALQALGIASAVVPSGKQHKVSLQADQAGAQPQPGPLLDGLTTAEFPSPAEVKGAAETTEPAQKIPNFISKASPPNAAALTEKRKRVAELAKLPAIETASALAEQQAQLDLFAPVKEKRSRRGARKRKAPHES